MPYRCPTILYVPLPDAIGVTPTASRKKTVVLCCFPLFSATLCCFHGRNTLTCCFLGHERCFQLFFVVLTDRKRLSQAFLSRKIAARRRKELPVMALTTASQERNGWIQQARARLAARENQKPVTKAGAVRALWPEIERALKNGQSLKTIRD